MRYQGRAGNLLGNILESFRNGHSDMFTDRLQILLHCIDSRYLSFDPVQGSFDPLEDGWPPFTIGKKSTGRLAGDGLDRGGVGTKESGGGLIGRVTGVGNG